ncbi:hypothetical protein A3Q56_02902 [Intoshia linei]|uniref:Uncharacterized protein n=1 Tax=Intoshia linei TaxID=1819745 RepID=A0A177B6N8_9BILA|nr:hypothetical protein A3Q56_02902 [Intoshia linei]
MKYLKKQVISSCLVKLLECVLFLYEKHNAKVDETLESEIFNAVIQLFPISKEYIVYDENNLNIITELINKCLVLNNFFIKKTFDYFQSSIVKNLNSKVDYLCSYKYILSNLNFSFDLYSERVCFIIYQIQNELLNEMNNKTLYAAIDLFKLMVKLFQKNHTITSTFYNYIIELLVSHEYLMKPTEDTLKICVLFCEMCEAGEMYAKLILPFFIDTFTINLQNHTASIDREIYMNFLTILFQSSKIKFEFNKDDLEKCDLLFAFLLSLLSDSSLSTKLDCLNCLYDFLTVYNLNCADSELLCIKMQAMYEMETFPDIRAKIIEITVYIHKMYLNVESLIMDTTLKNHLFIFEFSKNSKKPIRCHHFFKIFEKYFKTDHEEERLCLLSIISIFSGKLNTINVDKLDNVYNKFFGQVLNSNENHFNINVYWMSSSIILKNLIGKISTRNRDNVVNVLFNKIEENSKCNEINVQWFNEILPNVFNSIVYFDLNKNDENTCLVYKKYYTVTRKVYFLENFDISSNISNTDQSFYKFNLLNVVDNLMRYLYNFKFMTRKDYKINLLNVHNNVSIKIYNVYLVSLRNYVLFSKDDIILTVLQEFFYTIEIISDLYEVSFHPLFQLCYANVYDFKETERYRFILESILKKIIFLLDNNLFAEIHFKICCALHKATYQNNINIEKIRYKTIILLKKLIELIDEKRINYFTEIIYEILPIALKDKKRFIRNEARLISIDCHMKLKKETMNLI